MANATISASEEVHRYCKNANENAKQLFNRLWTKTHEPSKASELPEEDEEEMFDEDCDESDEDWTYVRSSVDIGMEDHVEKHRLATGTGPLRDLYLKGNLGEKAVEMAFEAAGVTGEYLRRGMNFIAEDIGYYATFPTAEEIVRTVLARSPILKGLQGAFLKGRTNARRKSLPEQTPAETSSISETRTPMELPQTPSSRHRQEMERRFAGFEEIPILPPEEEGDEEWAQFP